MAGSVITVNGLTKYFGKKCVLDEVSFGAPDRSGETVKIDAAYVHKHVGDLAKNADLSRFIL